MGHSSAMLSGLNSMRHCSIYIFKSTKCRISCDDGDVFYVVFALYHHLLLLVVVVHPSAFA